MAKVREDLRLEGRNRFTKERQFRYRGDIPTEVYFKRAEFGPDVPQEQRKKNIDKFFQDHPEFLAVDKIKHNGR